MFLFVGETLTASAMGYFQEELSKAVVLGLFIPLIISSGGNAGSQASTLIIRAMALEEVKLRDWWRIMHREIFSGTFSRINFRHDWIFSHLPLELLFRHLWHSLAFSGNHRLFFLNWSRVMGVVNGVDVPPYFKKCGFDPAVSSAPFVATMVDVTGIIIYFSIALFILHGTLL